jgi:glycosyltransferase involved in cell wall biosynthesis
MDAGIFFYKQSFSKTATSPTKMGEFLACGVPCMSNAGVGDVGSILTQNKIGVVIDDFSKQEKMEGINEMLDLATTNRIEQRCRAFAEEYYSLNSGSLKYDNIYQSLL